MRLFVLVICVLCHFVHSLMASSIVGAYYENWSQYRPASGGRQVFFPNLIDPTIVTDLYFAFGIFGFVTASIDPNNPHLTGDYTMQPVEWNDQTVLYPQFQALKERNPKLRTLLSVGGWSFNDPNDPNGMGEKTYQLFSQMVSDADARSECIQSAISYAKKYGFDGIDIDWEYPGDVTRGGKEEDFDNFVVFLQEAYAACHAVNPPLLLTCATAAIVPSGVSQKYHDDPGLYFSWLATCSTYLDRLNVMAYDYHGSFDNPKITGVNAPLYRDTDITSVLFVEKTVQNYLRYGVPANKIVLGMPTYGHSFGGVEGMSDTDYAPGKQFVSPGMAGPSTGTPGMLAYFEVADMTAGKTLTFGTDSETSTACGYNVTTREWVSFDTPDTIALKIDLVKEYALQGAMFWAVDDDEYQWGDTYPNIRKGYDLLQYQ